MKKPHQAPNSRGLALVEVLVSMVLLTIAMVAVLECLAHMLKFRQQAGQQWEESLRKWNQVQELRATFEAGEPVVVIPGAKPMSRFYITAETSQELSGWEVLRAPR